ncbi:hypothetical protein DMH04_50730 [Kibdelosporangium aridum]|uniref:Uncharacterized protein n=1 Tax=Kibdelosporangium aridum TaxID=2030 RepID=A0A428YAY0_KIBAR|nr:hypothetical protein [Kibdelosporangium aridum]RSM64806.1 hypothetical protein DMH04_50730 [Kibdelosporangium aridum]
MLKRVIAAIDGYAAEAGVIGIAGAVTSLLAFGGMLSALFGSSGIKAAAIVASIVGILGLFALLLASRKDVQRFHQHDKRLLSRYCDIIIEELDPAWRILFWEQIDLLESNGDTTETITIHARVDSKELHFFRLRFGSLGEPLPDRLRKRVTVKVRNVLIDGVGGTRFDATTYWLADGRIEVLAHFDTPAQHGSEAKFSMEVYWPAKSALLLKHREPDLFRIHFSKVIELARYVVVLPTGEDAYYDPVGFRNGENGCEIYASRNSSNLVEVSFVARNVEPDRLIGMRLDLK